MVTWTELTRWDFKSAQAARFRLLHPAFKPLGEYIEDATVLVDASGFPETSWAVYGVSNTKGVFFSHRQKGTKFNAKYKYKKIEEGWFFHNPTRANIGSIGRVPKVSAEAITSPEYQIWRPKEGVSTDFIEILVSSKMFLGLIDIHRVGAVKQRLFLSNLMEIPIPELTPEQQEKVVTEVQAARRALNAARVALDTAEREAGERLLALVAEDYRAQWRQLVVEDDNESLDETALEAAEIADKADAAVEVETVSCEAGLSQSLKQPAKRGRSAKGAT